MKTIIYITRCLIFLACFAYASFVFFVGQFLDYTSKVNSFYEQMITTLIFGISLAICVAPFFLFRKKNLVPILILLISPILLILIFIPSYGYATVVDFNNENTLYSIIFIAVIIFLYKLIKMIDK